MSVKEITDRIITLVKKNCALEEIVTENSRFSELSTDSLSFISMLVEIEDCFGIDCDDGLIMSEYETVRDLIDFVRGKLDAKKI